MSRMYDEKVYTSYDKWYELANLVESRGIIVNELDRFYEVYKADAVILVRLWRVIEVNNSNIRSICRNLKLDYADVEDYINGIKVPDIEDAHLIADYFNVKVDDIWHFVRFE